MEEHLRHMHTTLPSTQHSALRNPSRTYCTPSLTVHTGMYNGHIAIPYSWRPTCHGKHTAS